MDKFGIFKLLSALNNQSGDIKDNPLGAIMQSLGQNSAKPEPAPEPKQEPPAYAHLTSPMLETMRRHDEFLKRVHENSGVNDSKSPR